MNAEQYAALHLLSVSTVRMACRDGRIPAHRETAPGKPPFWVIEGNPPWKRMQAVDLPEPCMTTREYARKHGYVYKTVMNACAEGKLRCYKITTPQGYAYMIPEQPWFYQHEKAVPQKRVRPHRDLAPDERIAARALMLVARHWRKGAEFPLDAFRVVYQALQGGDRSPEIVTIHDPMQEAV